MAKILVVDDEADYVDLLETRIAAAGHDVIKANGGQEALKKIQDDKPDLVVLDIIMPDLTGTDVLKKIRADKGTKELPVIMLTALDGPDEVVKHFDMGVEVFLTKPINSKELLEHIADILGR